MNRTDRAETILSMEIDEIRELYLLINNLRKSHQITLDEALRINKCIIHEEERVKQLCKDIKSYL